MGSSTSESFSKMKARLDEQFKDVRRPEQYPSQERAAWFLTLGLVLTAIAWGAWYYFWWPRYAWIAILVSLAAVSVALASALLAHRRLQGNPFIDAKRSRWWFRFRYPTRILAAGVGICAIVLTGLNTLAYRPVIAAGADDPAEFGETITTFAYGKQDVQIALSLVNLVEGVYVSSQDGDRTCWEATFATSIERVSPEAANGVVARLVDTSERFTFVPANAGDGTVETPDVSPAAAIQEDLNRRLTVGLAMYNPDNDEDLNRWFQGSTESGNGDCFYENAHSRGSREYQAGTQVGMVRLQFVTPADSLPEQVWILSGSEENLHSAYINLNAQGCLATERAVDDWLWPYPPSDEPTGCRFIVDLGDQFTLEAVAQWKVDGSPDDAFPELPPPGSPSRADHAEEVSAS